MIAENALKYYEVQNVQFSKTEYCYCSKDQNGYIIQGIRCIRHESDTSFKDALTPSEKCILYIRNATNVIRAYTGNQRRLCGGYNVQHSLKQCPGKSLIADYHTYVIATVACRLARILSKVYIAISIRPGTV